MFGFIKHLFIPHQKNNHRAKILHNLSLLLIIFFMLVSSWIVNQVKISRPDVLGVSYSISEGDLLSLVNNERQSRGLSPLSLNSSLSDASRRKAADMLAKNYWAHFAPDGSTSPWGFIRAAGYNYKFAGENLAKGFTDSGSVVSAWMNSQTHRDNILSPKYTEIGFAIVEGNLQGEDTVLVVELFGTPQGAVAVQTPVSSVQAAKSPEPSPAIEIKPSPTIQIIPSQAPIAQAKEATPQAKVENNPKIDSSILSKGVSTVGLSFLVFGFLMDMIIVERKKIPRVVGHNLDHLMLISMFILFMILMRGGVII